MKNHCHVGAEEPGRGFKNRMMCLMKSFAQIPQWLIRHQVLVLSCDPTAIREKSINISGPLDRPLKKAL
jgi:hypothetical protein